jgi:molybdenum cofactor biosynthesis enzyme MoaA
MARSRYLHKVIGGRKHTYDSVLDVIYVDRYRETNVLDRTQTELRTDMCIEVTTLCNWTCLNCFSESVAGSRGAQVDIETVRSYIASLEPTSLRVCITGGEPMTHPEIESILEIPSEFSTLAFVLSTNGTLRSDLDASLAKHEWLVAISLHGTRDTHNAYTRSKSFDAVIGRVVSLSRTNVVHIYSVLHDQQTREDIDWLKKFREDSGAAFLRFIIPRAFGRFQPLSDDEILAHAQQVTDSRTVVKTSASLTHFLSVDGKRRMTK